MSFTLRLTLAAIGLGEQIASLVAQRVADFLRSCTILRLGVGGRTKAKRSHSLGDYLSCMTVQNLCHKWSAPNSAGAKPRFSIKQRASPVLQAACPVWSGLTFLLSKTRPSSVFFTSSVGFLSRLARAHLSLVSKSMALSSFTTPWKSFVCEVDLVKAAVSILNCVYASHTYLRTHRTTGHAPPPQLGNPRKVSEQRNLSVTFSFSKKSTGMTENPGRTTSHSCPSTRQAAPSVAVQGRDRLHSRALRRSPVCRMTSLAGKRQALHQGTTGLADDSNPLCPVHQRGSYIAHGRASSLDPKSSRVSRCPGRTRSSSSRPPTTFV